VELDAVHERKSGMYTKFLVRLAVHANPWILGVHLVNDPVPLHLRLANNEAAEQLICLLGLCNREVLLGLEDFLELVKLVLLFLFFCSLSCCQGN
jgi:hypothetical protein